MIRFADMKKVYEKLVDGKSQEIFDMWLSYALGQSDFYDFYKLVKDENFRLYDYQKFQEK